MAGPAQTVIEDGSLLLTGDLSGMIRWLILRIGGFFFSGKLKCL
jgi:hypothetical protein